VWVLEGGTRIDRQRGHHPTKVGPVGCPSPLEHTRHVREAQKGPDAYSNGLPRTVKGKSDGSTGGGEKACFKNNSDWSIMTTTWEICRFLVIDHYCFFKKKVIDIN
jgi:hypothetical protein